MHRNNLDSQTVFSHACQIATSMIWLAEAISYMIYNEIQVFSGNYPKPQYLNIRICLISDLKMVLNARFEITAPLSNTVQWLSVFSCHFTNKWRVKRPYFIVKGERWDKKGCGKTLQNMYEGQEPALRKWW